MSQPGYQETGLHGAEIDIAARHYKIFCLRFAFSPDSIYRSLDSNDKLMENPAEGMASIGYDSIAFDGHNKLPAFPHSSILEIRPDALRGIDIAPWPTPLIQYFAFAHPTINAKRTPPALQWREKKSLHHSFIISLRQFRK